MTTTVWPTGSAKAATHVFVCMIAVYWSFKSPCNESFFIWHQNFHSWLDNSSLSSLIRRWKLCGGFGSAPFSDLYILLDCVSCQDESDSRNEGLSGEQAMFSHGMFDSCGIGMYNGNVWPTLNRVYSDCLSEVEDDDTRFVKAFSYPLPRWVKSCGWYSRTTH